MVAIEPVRDLVVESDSALVVVKFDSALVNIVVESDRTSNVLTRNENNSRPTVDIALVDTKLVQALIERLACPSCGKEITCVNWKHIAGGFCVTIKCLSFLCSFCTIFNSSPKLDSRRYAVGTKFSTAWQLAGLTFQTMEWVFKTCGALPPLSKQPYYTLLNKV